MSEIYFPEVSARHEMEKVDRLLEEHEIMRKQIRDIEDRLTLRSSNHGLSGIEFSQNTVLIGLVVGLIIYLLASRSS